MLNLNNGFWRYSPVSHHVGIVTFALVCIGFIVFIWRLPKAISIFKSM